MEIIQQIYGPREGLIRVAPALSRMIPCQIIRQNGEAMMGSTQEMSEMGVRLFLERPYTIKQEEPVVIRFKWEDESITQFDGILFVPDVASEIVQTGGPNREPVLVYFRNASLKALDDLSQRMHEPVLPEAL